MLTYVSQKLGERVSDGITACFKVPQVRSQCIVPGAQQVTTLYWHVQAVCNVDA
jgi:hypothetical protein